MAAFTEALRALCDQHNCILQTPVGVKITVLFESDPDAESDDSLAEVTLVEERI